MVGKKIVVLQVIGEMVMGGAESRIMDLLRALDPEKVHYDFLVFNPKEQHYDKEIEARGSHVYRLQPRFKIYNYASFCKALNVFFAEHPEIDIVQGHMTSTAAIYLPIAKKHGVKCTIAHARSAGVDPGLKGTLTKWLRKDLYKKTDVCFACSPEAAVSVFGRQKYEKGEVRILPNAVELGQYQEADEMEAHAQLIRKKYDLQDAFVIGHVGRFHYAKNHGFLLEVFQEIRKKKSNAKMLLVGDGDTMPAVKEKAEQLGITDQVIFTGMQKDTAGYYCSMDLVVFPSHYEGLPGTVVEAQAAGLPVLMSDTVTDQVAVTPLVERFSLQKNAAEWAAEAMAFYERLQEKLGTETFRKECFDTLCEKGFDVTSQARQLEQIYAQMLKN